MKFPLLGFALCINALWVLAIRPDDAKPSGESSERIRFIQQRRHGIRWPSRSLVPEVQRSFSNRRLDVRPSGQNGFANNMDATKNMSTDDAYVTFQRVKLKDPDGRTLVYRLASLESEEEDDYDDEDVQNTTSISNIKKEFEKLTPADIVRLVKKLEKAAEQELSQPALRSDDDDDSSDEDDDEDNEDEDRIKDEKEDLPEDLNSLTEDIADDVAAGVEEALRITSRPSDYEAWKKSNTTLQHRYFTVHLYQGHYFPEPRLNRFIDGIVGNIKSEVRTTRMDPLYFRVVRHGRKIAVTGGRLRRPLVRLPFRRRPALGTARGRRPARRRRRRRRRRRKPGRRRRRRRRRRPNRRRPGKRPLVTRRKNGRQIIGGGRVEGLSKIKRDGDAEMQIFGNYTLIRSHYKMGKVELALTFRTRRGIRRTGATLDDLRLHSVTRVSADGSEMIDFVLDSPHPETIEVRGSLFPLAHRIARNIFAALFRDGSFLISQLRSCGAHAMLSRPAGYQEDNRHHAGTSYPTTIPESTGRPPYGGDIIITSTKNTWWRK